VSRMCGRPVELPGETELVAVGAAALAAEALSGDDARTIADRWAAQRAPTSIASVPRDDACLTRVRTVRAYLAALNACE